MSVLVSFASMIIDQSDERASRVKHLLKITQCKQKSWRRGSQRKGRSGSSYAAACRFLLIYLQFVIAYFVVCLGVYLREYQ